MIMAIISGYTTSAQWVHMKTLGSDSAAFKKYAEGVKAKGWLLEELDIAFADSIDHTPIMNVQVEAKDKNGSAVKIFYHNGEFLGTTTIRVWVPKQPLTLYCTAPGHRTMTIKFPSKAEFSAIKDDSAYDIGDPGSPKRQHVPAILDSIYSSGRIFMGRAR
jgi:hypothetical protein